MLAGRFALANVWFSRQYETFWLSGLSADEQRSTEMNIGVRERVPLTTAHGAFS